MQTRLTLRMDAALIDQAKRYAEGHGISLSQLVADYFASFTLVEQRQAAFEDELSPLTRSLVGILSASEFEPSDYERYLQEKYR